MNPIYLVILKSILPVINKIASLIEIIVSSDSKKLDRGKVEGDIEVIKSWLETSSQGDWEIVRKGKKK